MIREVEFRRSVNLSAIRKVEFRKMCISALLDSESRVSRFGK